MTRIFIAGAGGFIASHLTEYIEQNTDWEVCNTNPDYVVHLAGCSQIDQSISDPAKTVKRDIDTTLQLLEVSRAWSNVKKFLYFSSDEVFGPKEVICDFNPWDRYNSHSPYAAGKAACEELCLAWASTYGVPTVITHCQNLIGERQPANKFLPTVVRCALKGEPVPVYIDDVDLSRFILPRRNFLHVRDACSAIVLLLEYGKVRDKYNIASSFEITNEILVEAVSKIMHVEIKLEMRVAKNVRPGFFVQHGLNGSKLEELGWKRRPLMESLSQTVLWMTKPENRHWIGL
jgi:dTDP-D-glucose 4,6-dehydratase